MPDQPTDHNRPPRKGKPTSPRPSRKRDGDTPARPPRSRDEATSPRPPRQRDEAAPRREQGKRRGSEGGGQRTGTRPPQHREAGNQAGRLLEGALYMHYRNDSQWPAIREFASRALVLMTRLLLESLGAAGWQVIANRRTDAPEYTFGFDNLWTLRRSDSSREVKFSPEQSYRDLLYIAAPYDDSHPETPELDRKTITSAATMEQKAAIIVRRTVAALEEDS